MGYVKKHLKLLKRIIILNFRKFNEYKADYYMRLGTFAIMFLINILFWQIILLKTELQNVKISAL